MDPLLLDWAGLGIDVVIALVLGRFLWHYSRRSLMVETLWAAYLEQGRTFLREHGYNPHPPLALDALVARCQGLKAPTDPQLAEVIVRKVGPVAVFEAARAAELSSEAAVAAVINLLRR